MAGHVRLELTAAGFGGLPAHLRAPQENMNGMMWCCREVTIPRLLSTKQVPYRLDDDSNVVDLMGLEPIQMPFGHSWHLPLSP